MEVTALKLEKTYTLADDRTVNRMGYGAMRITGEGIWGPPRDRKQAIKVLKRAVELGVNFIDTADSYGPFISEELIAEALHPYSPDLVIATKGGLLRTGPNLWPVNAHPDHLKEALEGSLKRLKLEQIYLYQLHRVDPKVPFENSLEFLFRAQRDGLVKHVGLSEVTIEQIKQAREVVDVVSVQNMYSIDNRKWEAVLDYCQQNNIAFIPWYPLDAGNVRTVERLTRVAEHYDVTPHQVALSWLLHHSPNILLIPGTSKVRHLEDNYKAMSISLSQEDMITLNELKVTL